MVKQNRFFPILNGLMEVTATTSKKQGHIKVAIPDELISQLMKLMMNQPIDISNVTIGYQDSTQPDHNPCAVDCSDCGNYLDKEFSNANCSGCSKNPFYINCFTKK